MHFLRHGSPHRSLDHEIQLSLVQIKLATETARHIDKETTISKNRKSICKIIHNKNKCVGIEEKKKKKSRYKYMKV